jgi:hypothetical protein
MERSPNQVLDVHTPHFPRLRFILAALQRRPALDSAPAQSDLPKRVVGVMKSKVHCCLTATLPTLESHTALRLNGVQKAVNAVLQQADPEQAWTAATALSRCAQETERATPQRSSAGARSEAATQISLAVRRCAKIWF